jgi:hypothetical protein
MIARPHRIDTDARSGKRRDVAAAWRRLIEVGLDGYYLDDAGRWARRVGGQERPIAPAVAIQLINYITTGAGFYT